MDVASMGVYHTHVNTGIHIDPQATRHARTFDAVLRASHDVPSPHPAFGITPPSSPPPTLDSWRAAGPPQGPTQALAYIQPPPPSLPTPRTKRARLFPGWEARPGYVYVGRRHNGRFGNPFKITRTWPT
jgi:hypothetical protein